MKKASLATFGEQLQSELWSIQATGPSVLLYHFEPKRCVPLDTHHMLPSDERFVFRCIQSWRYTSLEAPEHVCLCVCEGKSIGGSEKGTECESVAEVHHSCSVSPGFHRGGSAERVPECHSCGRVHSALQAHAERGVSMSAMHDHISCLWTENMGPWGAHISLKGDSDDEATAHIATYFPRGYFLNMYF